MGGLVAQRTAIRHPNRVASLTSSSAVPSDTKGLSVLRYVRIALLPRFARLHYPETPEGDLDLTLAVARLLVAPSRRIDDSDVREFVEKETAHHVSSFRDDKAQSRQIGAKWHGGALDRISAPTLVLHGDQDPLLRVKAAHDLAAAIPGARKQIMPNVGHFLTREAWAAYATAIREVADQSDLTDNS